MAPSRRRKTERRRLLILACSARKRAADEPIPAWELYDGAAFRVVKRLQREGSFPGNVDILVLSAMHGIISPLAKITTYDQRMVPATAQTQAAQNARILRRRLRNGSYSAVYLSMGAAYGVALSPFEAWQSGTPVRRSAGRIGEQLRDLKSWLLTGTEKSCDREAQADPSPGADDWGDGRRQL
jgi:hypothetical protein